MKIDLSALFDDYSLRARVYPGLLTTLPVLTSVLLLWPNSGLNALWPIVVSVGAVFFLANVVRGRGQRLEARLVAEWDGMPTTHMLRHRKVQNTALFNRRRRGLERVFGEPLPGADAERADPAAADATYVAATRALIARVRDVPRKYPRVHDENIQYGFRRNLLGLKPIGLFLVVVVLIAGAIAAAVDFHPVDAVALGIDLLVALAWVAVVNRAWVRQAADTYADRLFETLEQDGLTNP